MRTTTRPARKRARKSALGTPCLTHAAYHPWRRPCWVAWQEFVSEHLGHDSEHASINPGIWDHWNAKVERAMLWQEFIELDTGDPLKDRICSVYRVFPWEIGTMEGATR